MSNKQNFRKQQRKLGGERLVIKVIKWSESVSAVISQVPTFGRGRNLPPTQWASPQCGLGSIKVKIYESDFIQKYSLKSTLILHNKQWIFGDYA